jgi:hypothetical protein
LGAQVLNIGIVGVGSSGSDHDEIAAARALTHPLKGSVNVCTTPHYYEAGAERCGRLRISRVTDNKGCETLLVLLRVKGRRKSADCE